MGGHGCRSSVLAQATSIVSICQVVDGGVGAGTRTCKVTGVKVTVGLGGLHFNEMEAGKGRGFDGTFKMSTLALVVIFLLVAFSMVFPSSEFMVCSSDLDLVEQTHPARGKAASALSDISRSDGGSGSDSNSGTQVKRLPLKRPRPWEVEPEGSKKKIKKSHVFGAASSLSESKRLIERIWCDAHVMLSSSVLTLWREFIGGWRLSSISSQFRLRKSGVGRQVRMHTHC
ncbi:hypothetical protein TIFTF001_034434 [Ficus carica]|uniref:Uncharacterized protein n=1 Tax=Ficus carica TaxID=3494 RepID=A0AA88E077_FICCA|nr:hypothetical protein TIFTF001_034434 [Ficus carica]